MNKLLAVGCVDFPCKRALVGFGHTCAIQCMGPTETETNKPFRSQEHARENLTS